MFLTFLLLLFLFNPHPVSAFDLQKSHSVDITASIGENEVIIYGYTSPKSKVELTGINIYTMTFSDSDGYFIFDKTILPKLPGELCLQSTDQNELKNTLTCFPPPPETNYHTDIGPILLPPTISLETDKVEPDSFVITSGQSIPNSTLHVFFYKVTDSAKSFPKPLYAYSLPNFTTTTDANGHYNLNLPTAYSSNYRLYSSVDFQGRPSPKSNTLFYSLPSLFQLFLKNNPLFFILIPVFLFTLLLYLLILIAKSQIIYNLIIKHFFPALRTFYPALRRPVCIYPDNLHRSTKIPN